MKLTWRGNWKKGEIIVETETIDELIAILSKLEAIEPVTPSKSTILTQAATVEAPKISRGRGPTQTVRKVLGSDWGRAEPRTMKEISTILEANAIFYSSSSLSGVLTNLTKKGELKRAKKKGQWAYTLIR